MHFKWIPNQGGEELNILYSKLFTYNFLESGITEKKQKSL